MRRAFLTLVVLVATALASLVIATSAFAASAPSIISESVSNVTATDATLAAQINPNGLETTYQFRLESGCLWPRACAAITVYPLPSGELPASSEVHSVNLDLNSAGVTLKPNTEYAYTVEAANAAGTTKGPEQRFTTPGGPVIESESVSHVTATDAILEAQIYPGGLETSYRFRLEWGCGLSPNEVCPLYCNTGPEASPSSEATWSWCEGRHVVSLPSGQIPASFQAQNVSRDLNEAGITLQPGTMYRYSVVATNSAGKAEGAGQTFTTIAGEAPVIESESVSHITETDATLEAQINTEGQETTYQFQLRSPLCRYPAQCIPIINYSLPSGKLLGSFVSQSVSLDLNSAGVTLQQGKEYLYSVTATNAAGSVEGPWHEFEPPSDSPPLNAQTSGTGGQLPAIQSPPSTAASHHRRHRRHRRHKRGLHRSTLHRASRAG
jgi:hypothetical protein